MKRWLFLDGVDCGEPGNRGRPSRPARALSLREQHRALFSLVSHSHTHTHTHTHTLPPSLLVSFSSADVTQAEHTLFACQAQPSTAKPACSNNQQAFSSPSIAVGHAAVLHPMPPPHR